MLVGLDVAVDDFVVKAGTYDTDIVSVLGCGEGKGGAHHSGSDDCDGLFHIVNQFASYKYIKVHRQMQDLPGKYA